ncbi:MAG TPA: hypothetical protein VFE61_18090 [Candidatus Sulfotelmatobacter sp.]|jgi:hypothetical protein|nr:hypothetical protein [Candidatus Sulfotelmatobacter sp.]
MSSSATKKTVSMKIAILTAFVVAGVAVLTQSMAAQVSNEEDFAPEVSKKSFLMHPNPKFLSCLGVAGGPTPTARVLITRGKLNDTLTIKGANFKPGLAFDMFTVERSNLVSDGTVDPNFTNFGMAWYQSDLQANSEGSFTATIQTILLDQIFGFDPDQSNPKPINTFHLGFWFNNPHDANVDGCVFDVTKPTPFNGEHVAGPVAFITTPNATTNLGPLCTNPNTSTHPASCHP